MGFIEFEDRGFEQAVKDALKTDVDKLTADELIKIQGIHIAEQKASAIGIPWQLDSTAFNMKIPNLYFGVRDSENGLWIEDLKKFSHIVSLYILVETEDISFLKEFSKLHELYVRNSRTSDWSFLADLLNLEYLFLQTCNIKDLTPIRDLHRNQMAHGKTVKGYYYMLDNLKLIDCGISDITPLAECDRFNELDLSRNNISDIRPLVKASAFHLTLRYNDIEDLSPFKELKRELYYLNLRHNRISDISPLSKLKGLRFLYLGHNKIKKDDPLLSKLKIYDREDI